MESKRTVVTTVERATAAPNAATDRVEELVAEGRSRLAAQRIVELERSGAEAGRARRHHFSHR